MHSNESGSARPEGEDSEVVPRLGLAGLKGKLSAKLDERQLLLERRDGSGITISLKDIERIDQRPQPMLPRWTIIISIILVLGAARVFKGDAQIWMMSTGISLFTISSFIRRPTLRIDMKQGDRYRINGLNDTLTQLRFLIDRLKEGVTITDARRKMTALFPNSEGFPAITAELEKKKRMRKIKSTLVTDASNDDSLSEVKPVSLHDSWAGPVGWDGKEEVGKIPTGPPVHPTGSKRNLPKDIEEKEAMPLPETSPKPVVCPMMTLAGMNQQETPTPQVTHPSPSPLPQWKDNDEVKPRVTSAAFEAEQMAESLQIDDEPSQPDTLPEPIIGSTMFDLPDVVPFENNEPFVEAESEGVIEQQSGIVARARRVVEPPSLPPPPPSPPIENKPPPPKKDLLEDTPLLSRRDQNNGRNTLLRPMELPEILKDKRGVNGEIAREGPLEAPNSLKMVKRRATTPQQMSTATGDGYGEVYGDPDGNNQDIFTEDVNETWNRLGRIGEVTVAADELDRLLKGGGGEVASDDCQQLMKGISADAVDNRFKVTPQTPMKRLSAPPSQSLTEMIPTSELVRQKPKLPIGSHGLSRLG